MFCENCGSRLPEGAKFCGDCGAKLEAQSAGAVPVGAAAAASQTYASPASGQSFTPPNPNYANPAPPQPYAPPNIREPLRVGQYVGIFLLLCLPVANLVLLFVWAFGGGVNLNKKNYARAALIMLAAVLVLWIVLGSVLAGVLQELIYELS